MLNSSRVWCAVPFAVLVFSLGASGCHNPMALKTNRALSLEKESVAIFTLRTTNEYKPIYRPKVLRIHISVRNEIT